MFIGAGYAGGIVSAAVDGMKVSQAIRKYVNTHDNDNGNE